VETFTEDREEIFEAERADAAILSSSSAVCRGFASTA